MGLSHRDLYLVFACTVKQTPVKGSFLNPPPPPPPPFCFCSGDQPAGNTGLPDHQASHSRKAGSEPPEHSGFSSSRIRSWGDNPMFLLVGAQEESPPGQQLRASLFPEPPHQPSNPGTIMRKADVTHLHCHKFKLFGPQREACNSTSQLCEGADKRMEGTSTPVAMGRRVRIGERNWRLAGELRLPNISYLFGE